MTGRALLQLSFVIPVRNGASVLARCLEHIRRERVPGDQIIVVDNGSTDGTQEMIRRCHDVTLLEAPGVRRCSCVAGTDRRPRISNRFGPAAYE